MVAAKAWSWTDDARERFPDMDQLQRNRMDDLQPLLASMSLSQVLRPCVVALRPSLGLWRWPLKRTGVPLHPLGLHTMRMCLSCLKPGYLPAAGSGCHAV